MSGIWLPLAGVRETRDAVRCGPTHTGPLDVEADHLRLHPAPPAREAASYHGGVKTERVADVHEGERPDVVVRREPRIDLVRKPSCPRRAGVGLLRRSRSASSSTAT